MKSLFKILFLILCISLSSAQYSIAKDAYLFDEIDNNLSLMAGQMILTGFKGTSLSEDPSTIEALKAGTLGNVILFYSHKGVAPHNLASAKQIKALIEEINSYSRYPLFIGIDQEGGLVQRISSRNGFKDWQSAQKLGQSSTKDTYKSAKDMGNSLAQLGFNLNFAPSVDLLDPNSPAIGKLERSFSKDPAQVVKHAKAFVRGMEENNIVSALKHFPGHGSAMADSHEGFTDVTNTWTEEELIPYKMMIEDNFSGMIMTAHVYNAKLDNKPASLSYKITTKILREQLGFKGVIISDDMQMKAVSSHYSLKDTVYLAIQGGSDILLFGNNLEYDKDLAKKVHSAILELVADGKITEERIKESWQRIRAIKEAFFIH